MCISSSVYEKYLNFVGMIKNAYDKYSVSFNPNDIIFEFTINQSETSLKIKNEGKDEDEKFTKYVYKTVKEISNILNSYTLQDELTKKAILSKKLEIYNDLIPMYNNGFTITGKFYDGIKESNVNLHNNDITLILTIK